jgi:hypothetical protein
MICSWWVRVLQVCRPGANGTNRIVIKRGSGCTSIFVAEVGIQDLGHVLEFEDERLHLREAFWTAYTVQIHNELLEQQPILPKSESDEGRLHCCVSDSPVEQCKPRQTQTTVSEPRCEVPLLMRAASNERAKAEPQEGELSSSPKPY